ncbi:MAG: DUF1707 domain-containing protein [Propionibacteriaceae bacterium]|nr:DUF1707 domain-containing protein [Propionibacteriaceae bacterium]
MSGSPIESRFVNAPNQAVAEKDRNDISERLKEAFATGAIEMPQFFELLEHLWAARINADLIPVLAGVPVVYRASAQPALGGDSVGGPPGEAPRGPGLFGRD